MNKSISQKATKGIVWTTIQRFARMGIRFISGIILARLLMPEDYGAIGMLTIFMSIAQIFLDSGFGEALIQKKAPSQEDYSTIFYWNLAMSVFLYLLLYVSAPFISEFYHMPILCDVLRVQAIVLIISAFSLIQANRLRKRFEFKKLAIISIASAIISLIVTIYLAYRGFGVWALVIQGILMALLPAIAYWIIDRWIPSFVFSYKSFKELFSFGVYMLFTHVITKLGDNIQGLLIGRMYNANTMGYYSKAKSTEFLASSSISQSLIQVTFPLYSEYQNNFNQLVDVIKKLTSAVVYVTFPLMAILILDAKPIFVFLYSDRWVDSIPYFQILCFAGLAQCFQALNYQAIAAIGKSKTMFIWTIYKRVIGLVLMLIGFFIYGIKGLLIGMVVTSWTCYIINAYLVSKHIGYELVQQIKDLLPTLLITLFSMGIAYCCNMLSIESIYLDGFVKMAAFVMIYILSSVVLKIEAYYYFKQMLPMMLKRKKSRNGK